MTADEPQPLTLDDPTITLIDRPCTLLIAYRDRITPEQIEQAKAVFAEKLPEGVTPLIVHGVSGIAVFDRDIDEEPS